MPYGDPVVFKDNRGRYRKAETFEKNQFFNTKYFHLRGTLLKGIAQFQFKTGDRVAEAMVDFAGQLQDYARENAPWDDRTGDARRGLTADVVADPDDMTITLQHTVDYGIWLEIRWGGTYAIIIPTIEQIGPQIYDQMQGMCGEIIYYA